ncbi:MAG: DUF3604 domain-containing protein, partial [Anaerolineae bacterium]|nr:DUF3604 domain-containing protein [Anaerolineae bacterium]
SCPLQSQPFPGPHSRHNEVTGMRVEEDLRAWYGWAELSPPDPIEAGSFGHWQLIYHVGRYGIRAGGSLKLLFAAASDWAAPQGKDPYEESFFTVTTSGQGYVAWRYDPRGHSEPWPKAVTVDVARAGLAEGDTVTFHLGDPEGGSPGMRAPTFCERGHELRVVVDPFGTGHYVAVPSPVVDIVAGPAARLVLVAPSRVAPGEPFDLTIRIEDRWGNPVEGYAGSVDLRGLPGLDRVELSAADGGVRRVRCQGLDRPGTHRLLAHEARLDLAAESNPVWVEQRTPGTLLPLWGDLHAQSAEGCGGRAAPGCLRHARDVACLDFCSHQGSAYQIGDASWEELRETVRRHDEPGRFAAFLGYRWAGSTAGGGTRSVLFLRHDARILRCSRAQLAEGEEGDVCYPLTELYQALRGQEALLVASAVSPAANPDFYDPELERLVEVYSSWGQANWLLAEALRRGHRVGFVAGSADPRGCPGANCPGAGSLVSRGGLTCVYAAAHTRLEIWRALRSRRCYGTTGARILLDVQADGHRMGEVYTADRPPEFQVRISGTAEIERVEIWRGADLACRHPARDDGQAERVRIVWGGAMARDWPREAPWDGMLRLHGARILDVWPYAIDSPARGIVLRTDQSVSWRSATAGNENGVVLHLSAEPGARLDLYVPLATVSVGLDELPQHRDLGGEGLHIRVERLPQGTGRKDLEITWREDSVWPGETPYYVTVHQVDGARAWSSPIWVRAAG